MSNQNSKEIKDSDGNVRVRIEKFGVFDASPNPSIDDLVKRIETLEKQLADMQKATSCELDSAIQNALLQSVENGAKKAKELIKNQDFYQKPKQTLR